MRGGSEAGRDKHTLTQQPIVNLPIYFLLRYQVPIIPIILAPSTLCSHAHTIRAHVSLHQDSCTAVVVLFICLVPCNVLRPTVVEGEYPFRTQQQCIRNSSMILSIRLQQHFKQFVSNTADHQAVKHENDSILLIQLPPRNDMAIGTAIIANVRYLLVRIRHTR